MRILFVTPYVPSLVRTRSWNWLRVLSALGHRVHLVALQPPEDTWTDLRAVRRFCDGLDVFPLSRARTLTNAAVALPTRRSLQLRYSHHPTAERHLCRLVGTDRFDVMHVEHLRGAVLARAFRSMPLTFDAVDSISRLCELARRQAPRWTQRWLAGLELGRTRRFEARAPWDFDRTLVTSDADAEAFTGLAGEGARNRIAVLPNGVDLEYFQPRCDTYGRANTILFTGKISYHANGAAVLRLAHTIMPLVWAVRPDARLVIAGKDPPRSVRALARDPRIVVTGYVDDLRPYFANAAVAVAPLPYQVGVQNKILEAMACAVPVVASSDALGALGARPGADLRVAEDPAAFAQELVELLDDENARAAIGYAGRQYVERHHNWYTLGHQLIGVYRAARAEHPDALGSEPEAAGIRRVGAPR